MPGKKGPPKGARNPKSLANLRRGGTPNKPRGLTLQHRLWCFFYVTLKDKNEAARRVGLHPWMGSILLRKPEVLKFCQVAEEKMIDEAAKHIATQEFVDISFLDKHLKKAIVSRKTTHAQVHALELGFERTAVIARKGTANVSATANAAAAVQAGSTMKQIYKSKWLQDTENQIEKELIAERDQPLLPGTTETFSE